MTTSTLERRPTRPWTRAGDCKESPSDTDTSCVPMVVPGGATPSKEIDVKVTGRAGFPNDGMTAAVISLSATSTAVGSIRVNLDTTPGAHSTTLATLHLNGGGAGVPSNDTTLVIAVPDADGRISLTATSSAGGSFDVWAEAVGYFKIPETTTYTYSGDGLRRAKVSPDGTVTTFTWDRSGGLPLLLAEAINAPGTSNDRTVRYLYDPAGLVLADITSPATGAETIRWYHHDQLGSTIALTDAAGGVLATYAYTPFGELAASTGTATTPMAWAGEYHDTETGYVYLRARHYDPATGQFLTRDPIEPITRSAYGYVSNNPLNATDPTGMCPFCVAFVVGAVVGGGLDLGFQALGNVADGCGAFSDINWGSVAFNGLLGGGLSVGGAWLASARAAQGGSAFGDWAFKNGVLGADSFLFGSNSLGATARSGFA